MNLLYSEDPPVSTLNLLYNVKIEAFPDQRIQAGSANSTGKTIICVSSSSCTIAASRDLDKGKVSLCYVHSA